MHMSAAAQHQQDAALPRGEVSHACEQCTSIRTRHPGQRERAEGHHATLDWSVSVPQPVVRPIAVVRPTRDFTPYMWLYGL